MRISRLIGHITVFTMIFLLLMISVCDAIMVHEIDRHVESIASRVYSTRHGLPSNAIELVFQDQYGFIWCGTQEGVSRYDGQGFTIFNAFPPGIGTHVISSAIDRDDRYWFGTMRGLVVLSEKNGFQDINLGISERVRVDKIVVDGQGDVWITSNLTGPYRIDPVNLNLSSKDPALSDLWINDMAVDSEGIVWLATSGGLYRQNGYDFKHFPVPGYEDVSIHALWLHDNESGCFAVDSGKVISFTPTGIREIQLHCHRGSVSVLCFAGSDTDNVWIGTDRGLYHWEDDVVEHFTVDTGLTSNMIQSLIIDREGLLWYGTDNGLGKISGIQFRQLIASRDLPLSSIFDMCCDAQNRKWFATNEGLTLMDDTTITTWASAESFQDDYVVSVLATSDNRLFAANSQQVFEVRDMKIVPATDASFGSIMDLQEDREGEIWLADYREIYHLTKEGPRAVGADIGLPESVDVVTIFFDSENALWIITDGQGAFKASKDLTSVDPVENLPSNQIFSICSDQRDDIWLGSMAGACQLDGTLTRIVLNEQHGLASASVWTVVPDSQNNMWFSTSRGLSRLKNGKICNYDMEDGLSGDDLVTNCFLTDEKERLWFGGTGVTIVNTQVDIPVIAPRTYVKWAMVNGETLEPGARIPYGNNTFEFNILCQSYINENRNRYRYQLEGFDGYRSSPTRTGYIRYTNLGSGQYRLVAESSNRDGIWSEEPAYFEFEVLPAWWELYWVRMLMGFALIGMIVGTARVRNAAVRRRAVRLQKEVDRQTAVIKKQVDELAIQRDQLEKFAITDDLTSLYNRRYFFRIYTAEWSRQKRYQNSLSLLLFDIDDFKNFNDTFGHVIGDQILVKVGATIQNLIRETDTLARYGGEEFIVLMPETNMQNALEAADRICKEIGELAFNYSSCGEIQVHVSGGVSCKTGSFDALNPDSLIQQADMALYKAKREGKNRVIAYRSGL